MRWLLNLAMTVTFQQEAPPIGYLPLQVGNSWSFAATAAAGVERSEVIDSVVRIDRQAWYRFSSFAGTQGRLVRVDSQNRLWERIDDREVMRYNFDAPVGASWPYPGGIMTLESREEKITVPAGTFTRCVKFHYAFHGRDGDWDEWYAPGIGPVKRIQFGYAIVEYVLESFQIRPPQ